jgi:hypothetical protein
MQQLVVGYWQRGISARHMPNRLLKEHGIFATDADVWRAIRIELLLRAGLLESAAAVKRKPATAVRNQQRQQP